MIKIGNRLCTLLLCGFIISLPLASEAGVVRVVAGSKGQGIALKRGADCMVLTPGHVLQGVAQNIVIAGRQGEVGSAELDTAFHVNACKSGSQDNPGNCVDVRVLKVVTNAEKICDTEYTTYRLHEGAVIVSRTERGGFQEIPVELPKLGSKDSTYILIKGKSGFSLKSMMSGSLLLMEGKALGMVINACTDKGSVVGNISCTQYGGVAIKLSSLGKLVGPWASPDFVEPDRAKGLLGVVEHAKEMRASTNIGQIEALEELVWSSVDVQDLDLAGLYLRTVHLEDARLRGAQLTAANLISAKLARADLSGSRMGFADLAGADLTKAIIDKAFAPYVHAQGVGFHGASAQMSSWTAADLRDADFSGADLKGASFFYADLRGANFSGAKLGDASFIGALLENANFERAEVANTDFTLAVVGEHALTKDQMKGACRTVVTPDNRVAYEFELVSTQEETATSKFYYDVIFTGYPPMVASYQQGLPVCSQREFSPPRYASPYWTRLDKTYLKDKVTLYLQRSLITHGGREKEMVKAAQTYFKNYAAAADANKFLVQEQPKDPVAKMFGEGSGAAVERVPLTSDAVLLFSLKASPQMAERIDWNRAATERLALEQYPNDSIVGSQGDPWRAFFRANMYAEELDEKSLKQFREWTVGRADALPDKATLIFSKPYAPFFETSGASNRYSLEEHLKNRGVVYRAVYPNHIRLNRSGGVSNHLALPRPVSFYDVGPKYANAGGHVEIDVDLAGVSAELDPATSIVSDGILFYLVPEEVRFYEDKKVRKRIVLATKADAGEIKELLNHSIAIVSEPGSEIRRAYYFGEDGQLTEKTDFDESRGQWWLSDRHVCYSMNDEKSCYSLYKDRVGWLLVSANGAKRSWIKHISNLRHAGSPDDLGQYIRPAGRFDIVGLKLGMPIEDALDRTKKSLGSKNVATVTVDKIAKRFNRSGFDMPGVIASKGEFGKAGFETIGLFSYTGGKARVLDGVVRYLELDGSDEMRELVIDSLIEKYGKPDYRRNTQMHELGWIDRDYASIGTSLGHCFPSKLAYHLVRYANGYQGIGLKMDNISETGGCGPSLGASILANPGSGRVSVMTWLLDTRRVRSVAKQLETIRSEKASNKSNAAIKRVAF